ncbi:MAG: hypothetical protein GY856_26725 [bacterium]|nr:hypothetical protein [bacterium]
MRIELGEIEAALADHPSLREAVVLARERGLVAYVVPRREEVQVDAAALRAWLGERLPASMVPSTVVVLDAVPRTATGKADRKTLAELDLPQDEPAESYVAPRDGVELRLAGIWEEVLGRRFIDVRADFFRLGGHSLLSVQLMARIRREFAKDLPLATLFQAPTLEHLAAILRDQGAAVRREALVEIQPQGGERPHGGNRPLFFIHPIGGNVLCYAHLARHLGSEQPFYGLQTPELGPHQARLRDIGGMAEHYLEAVRVVEPAGPYRLGGWSMGGVVAFEMARRLAAEGEETELLALIDSFVPHPAGGPDEADDEALILALFVQDLQGLLARPLALSLEDLRHLSGDQGLARLFELARENHLLPPGVDLAQIRDLYDIFANNHRALRRYRAEPYTGKVTLLKAAGEASGQRRSPTRGWDELALGGVEVHEISGTHYSLLHEPRVQDLAQRLRALQTSGRSPEGGSC